MTYDEKIEVVRRLIIEFLFLSSLMLLTLLPLWKDLGVVPNFMSVVIYLWAIYRPDLLSRRLFIVLGICRDAMMGYPIGVGVLELLLMISLTKSFRRYVLEKKFGAIFWGYLLFTTLSNGLLWGLLSAMRGHFLPFMGALKPILLNGLAYPILCRLSFSVQQKIDALKIQGRFGG
jgi:rod shape-determining protein MreD